MSLVLLRTCTKTRNTVFNCGNNSTIPNVIAYFTKPYSDDRDGIPEFSCSTLLVENGYNVHELPVVVRRLKDIHNIERGSCSNPNENLHKNSSESMNYHLIQEEFKQCVDLRDVFTLITKCTKITPNIALGAIERINDLEKETGTVYELGINSNHINFAKGAILDKLLQVVLKTEDTQTILNILKTSSSLMEPFKHKFCDELLFRVIDNKLSLEQLCDFALFLINNNSDKKYLETVDRLWVGFTAKEGDIDEKNIVQLFNILPGLKVSKRTLLTLLEQKLAEIWYKIKVPAMQDILSIFLIEKYFSLQSFTVLSHWLYQNIHALDEESLLDVVTKFTRLKYSDDQVEAAIEKYMKLKGEKVSSNVLIVGILNYCIQFQLRSPLILSKCSKYFMSNRKNVPSNFYKSFLYPYGYLNIEPDNSSEFWAVMEEELLERYQKMNIDDLSSIVLSYVYSGHCPLKLVSKILSLEYVSTIKNSDTLKRLHLIDTALTLESEEYSGPMLPKNQCYTPLSQDNRIKNIILKIDSNVKNVLQDSFKVATAVFIPNYCPDETYMIDIMALPHHLSDSFNWKSKMDRHNVVAILIHLPDQFCSRSEHLIGPQVMRIRHLKLLGMKVVSLKYSILSQFYTSHNSCGLEKYILDSINNAEVGS